MSETRQPAPTIPTQRRAEPEVTGWVGWVFFAGIMMVTVGVVHAIQGLVAIFNSGYYVVPSSQLVVSVNYATWGWVHLIGGVVVAAAGVALFSGKTWARATAVVVAGLSALVNLAFISAYPWWAVIAIVLDVFVIYAVTVHGAEVRSV
jgi:hypothetical protein